MDKFEIRILLLFFVYRAEGIEEMCPSQLFAAHNSEIYFFFRFLELIRRVRMAVSLYKSAGFSISVHQKASVLFKRKYSQNIKATDFYFFFKCLLNSRKKT